MTALALLCLQVGNHSGEFYFARHGETLANSTGTYNSKTLNRFSGRGSTEVRDLTLQLEKLPRFDLILVSPAERTLRTISPYLKATGQRAIVWPLLYECCTGRRPKDAHPTRFGLGGMIEIPADLRSQFVLMKSERKLPVAGDYDSGLAQVQQAEKEFRHSYLGKRVLLIGHSGQGGHFIHGLTSHWVKLENARLERVTVP